MSETETLPETDETAAVEAVEGAGKLAQQVEVITSGPCRKHVKVTIPRADIDNAFNLAFKEMIDTASVPGFRKGRVPRALVEKKFRTEVYDGVRQKLLMASLEQVAEDHDLDAINEPDFDMTSLELHEQGDFSYEFDVEVRPDFALPQYAGLKIQRPVRETTDAEIERHTNEYIAQFGSLSPSDAPAQAGDHVTVSVLVARGGDELNRVNEKTLRLLPNLRFEDGEIAGFDALLAGAVPGDVRSTDVKISMEATREELRGETVSVQFTVSDVKRLKLPDIDDDFATGLGFESAEKFRDYMKDNVTRQNDWEVRQATRRQVLDKITESATWDLPESLVKRQVDNALRREVLEMQQAGFSDAQIRARKNDLMQHQMSSTRQALKEHFVLDRIATEEKIEVAPDEMEWEITMMALRRGESPRKFRARLEKQGLIENLVAQILERKAVDKVLEKAEFEDVPAPAKPVETVEAFPFSLCGQTLGSAALAQG
jgi:trigger factor